MWVKTGFQKPSFVELGMSASQEACGSPGRKAAVDSWELPGESEQGSEEGALAFIAPLGLFLPLAGSWGLSIPRIHPRRALNMLRSGSPMESKRNNFPYAQWTYDLVPASYSQEWIKDIPERQAWLSP